MSIVFYLIAALTVAGGLAAVLLKNTVHCALAVTIAFGGLALLFLSLDAQFAGFAQILVYIGAVAILVVFAILLTRGSETPEGGVFSTSKLNAGRTSTRNSRRARASGGIGAAASLPLVSGL